RAVPGDPLMVIRELAQQIADKGIKKVLGRVIVDTSMFREGARELGTGVVMSPIVVNDNIIDVVVTPGPEASPVTFKSSPQTSYVTFVNRMSTGKPDSEPEIRFVGKPNSDGTQNVEIFGTFPAGKPPILFKYVMPSPSRFAEVLLTEALREKGITVESQSFGGCEV